MDHKALLELREHPVFREVKVQKEFRVLKVLLELREHPVFRVRLEAKEQLEVKV